MPKLPKQTKKVKAWAVITERGSIKKTLSLPRGMCYIFPTRKSAVEHEPIYGGETVPVTITYSLPKRKK